MATPAMTVDLNNKTALLTGASSGIGAAVAEALGASLIADADRQQLDAGLLQPRQCWDQGLGVFQ